MKNSVTQKTIADELGISSAAVSYCLNGKPGVSDKLRQKVLRLAEKYHSRTPRLPIAVAFMDQIGPYTQNMLNEIVLQCRARKLPVIFLPSDNEYLIQSRFFRGVISLDYSDFLGKILPKKEPIPIISINCSNYPIENVYSVTSADKKMFTELFSRLKKKGHTRIGYCYYRSLRKYHFPDIRQQVMREAAMSFPKLTILERPITAQHSFVENVVRLKKEGVTALIMSGEGFEFRMRQAIQLLGIKIPEELALITWENPGESEFYDPPQTTVAQNIPLIVKTALDNLEALIEGKEISNVEVDYILHDRESW